MNTNLKDKLARAIHITLTNLSKRGLVKFADSVLVSESLVDSVELVMSMETEEAGVAAVPPGLSGDLRDPDPNHDVPWDLRRNRPADLVEAPAPERAINRVLTPPSGATAPDTRSPLLLPGQPGFDAPADVARRATSTRIIRPTKDPARVNAPQKPVWEASDLISSVLGATPEEITFETEDREGRKVNLTVKRNVHNQAGLDNVLLTYTHPAVNTTPTDASTIIPMAKVTFSTYDREVNVDEAIDGPKGIMKQLRGMYRARPESMEPQSGPEPGPLRLDMRNQPGDYHSEDFHPGQVIDNPHQIALDSNRRSNDALAPQGHRFR